MYVCYSVSSYEWELSLFSIFIVFLCVFTSSVTPLPIFFWLLFKHSPETLTKDFHDSREFSLLQRLNFVANMTSWLPPWKHFFSWLLWVHFPWFSSGLSGHFFSVSFAGFSCYLVLKCWSSLGLYFYFTHSLWMINLSGSSDFHLCALNIKL